MKLTDNNFIHQIPPEIGRLRRLQRLNLLNNTLSGKIPLNLSNCSRLMFLLLSNNKLEGQIPFELGFLSKMQFFGASKNNLSGSIPPSLGNWTFLEEFYVTENHLTGKIPNLSSTLTLLSISYTYISGSIPPSIDNLVGLEYIEVAHNQLTGTIPPTIGNLKNLVVLYLFESSLSGWIPKSIGNLSNLIDLALYSNSLEGSIPPSLQNCTSLQLLYLHNNNLSGFIPPQMMLIPSLTIGLSLYENQLIGPLPEEVGKLTNLNLFDVTNNMLSGKIPDSIGECTSMEFLYLGGNNFQGSIPSSLSSMKGLQELDISSNNLSGQIPQLLASLNGLTKLNISFNNLDGVVPVEGVFTNSSATFLKGNNKLCGGIPHFHLPACRSFRIRKKRNLLSKRKVIIASTGGFAGVASLIILLILFLCKSRRKRRQSREEHEIALSKNPALEFVSYGDLHRATNGFSEGNLLGAGNFGSVYKGILGEEGQVIAVKVLNLKKMGANRSFVAECEALRNIRHKNLVKLFTVCSGTDYQGNEFKALVYEFMLNGSLEDWLYPHAIREDDIVHHQIPVRKLGLLRRLGIVIDVASSLEYVHHHCGAPLVHRDIKPSNILLDDDLSGRVSDFGLSKFLSESGFIQSSVHPSSSIGVRGTVGYAPPEYGLGSEVSTQGDVYSFGILLLEMFTGKRPTDELFKEDLNLHSYAKMALQSGVVDTLCPILEDLLEVEEHVFNPRRSSQGLNCLMSVIEVGVSCSLENPSDRMVMSMVTTKLIQIRDNLLKGVK